MYCKIHTTMIHSYFHLAFDCQAKKEPMSKKKSKFDKEITEIDIRGLKYKVCLYPKSIFNSRYPNTLAQVEEEPFIMRFCEENLQLNVIRHELFHCYMASCFLSTQTDISPGDTEEVACDVFAYLVDDILEMSYKLEEILKNELNKRQFKPTEKTEYIHGTR